MKMMVRLALLAGTAMLGACNMLGAADSGNTAENAAGNEVAVEGNSTGGDTETDTASAGSATGGKETGGAAPSGETPALTRSYVVGRWTDSEDCSTAVAFNQDGRFQTAQGTGGLWVLDGDQLILQGDQRASLRLMPIDQDTMSVINEDGSLGRSTRCQ